MVYFTRHAGNFRLPGAITTLCKHASIWVVVSVLLLGSAVDTRAKTYLETALGSLKNLPAEARLREDLELLLLSGPMPTGNPRS